MTPRGGLVDTTGKRGIGAVMMTLLLAPLLPFIAIAFLLGAERLERGLDHPKKRGRPTPLN